MGRPTKLDAEITEGICAELEKGTPLEPAAEAVEITVRTVYNWMDRGAKGEEPFASFFQAVTRARALGEIALLDRVRNGDGKGISFGPARAAAFLLERTHPERYAQRINLKVREAVEEVLECVRRVCSPEDFTRVCEELSRRDSGGEALADESEVSTSVH